MPASANQDLRSNAKEHRRVKSHNAKWSRGGRPAPGNHCDHDTFSSFTDCVSCNKRPRATGCSQTYTALRNAEDKRETARYNSMMKRAFHGTVVEAVEDVHDGLSDSSGDLDVNDASAAPELSEVMYSFDAPTGPTRGADVLSFAITQAVQRYENKETEKIIKNEYDLVLDGRDEPDSHGSAAGVVDDEDDFEVIDYSHLK